jgi:hypothetical protein
MHDEAPDSVVVFSLREHLLPFNVLEVTFRNLSSSLPPNFVSICEARLLLEADQLSGS